MRNRLSFFVAVAVLVTACADMSTPSTPSSSTTTTTQGSPVPGRDNSNNNPNPTTPNPNPNPNQPDRVELKGVIAARTGACPSITFSIGTSTVMTNAATTFDDGACSTLQNGVQVEVEGVRQANGIVLASRVENKTADDDDDEDDDDNDGDRHGGEARLDGSIGGLGGACPAITFSVSGSTVSTSASTRFDDACSSLKNGDRVEVRGVRQANNVVAASRVEKKK